MPDPREAVPLKDSRDWHLCRGVGLPCARAIHSEQMLAVHNAGIKIEGWPFAPRWVLAFLEAFERAGCPLNALGYHSSGRPTVSMMRRLVKKIIREGSYDLAEVRAALALGGPNAALQLAGAENAQDVAHEQTVTPN